MRVDRKAAGGQIQRQARCAFDRLQHVARERIPQENLASWRQLAADLEPASRVLNAQNSADTHGFRRTLSAEEAGKRFKANSRQRRTHDPIGGNVEPFGFAVVARPELQPLNAPNCGRHAVEWMDIGVGALHNDSCGFTSDRSHVLCEIPTCCASARYTDSCRSIFPEHSVVLAPKSGRAGRPRGACPRGRAWLFSRPKEPRSRREA